jgi:hypothetical protein
MGRVTAGLADKVNSLAVRLVDYVATWASPAGVGGYDPFHLDTSQCRLVGNVLLKTVKAPGM